MISAITSALSGLTSASKQVEESAASIASSPSQEQIIEDIVDIKQAEVAFKANIQTIKVANELTEELLNTFDKTV